MKKGGGATRLREHLGGISGNVMSCNVVPPDVRDVMRRAIRTAKQKRRDAKVVIDEVQLEKSSDAVHNKPIKLQASKRKRAICARKQKNKKGKKVVLDEEDVVGSDDDTDTPANSLNYAESEDSSSPEDDGADDDDEPDGKGGARGGEQYVQANESQAVNLPLRFSEEDHFTHATHDADHGSRPSRLAKKKDLFSLY